MTTAGVIPTTGSVDLGFVTFVAVTVLSLAVLRWVGLISSLDTTLSTLLREARELAAMKPTTGAINLTILLIMTAVVALYFVLPEFEAVFRAMNPATTTEAQDAVRPILFTLTAFFVLVAAFLCVHYHRTK